MSYEGAAFSQPSEKPVPEDQKDIVVHVKTDLDDARIHAEVVRVHEDAVAVKFTDIRVDARLIIDRVVTDRIIGLNMLHVNPRHYIENADYDHWFHGPRTPTSILGHLRKGITKAILRNSPSQHRL